MVPAIHAANKNIPWPELLLPWQIARQLRQHGDLILQLTKRDVLVRYRGSFLGIFWSLLRPLFTLLVYTVVFGYIFESKLGSHPQETKLDFALALFCGLILFDFFAECIARAPTLMLSNTNYVTKVVFPLEILPVMVVGAGFTQLVISCLPLVVALVCAHGSLAITVLYLPIILVPLVLLCLGFTWLLASLGVFIRDINAIVPVLLTILMYASAIFYSISRVPPRLLPLVLGNPLAVIIDEARNAVLWGTAPAWDAYGIILAVSLVAATVGYAFFMRTKNAFADVL
jgi:lipopolysaccharide transport system permease protein